MTDDSDNEAEEGGRGGDDEPLAGERLAAARRKQKIPIDEVARELHLDERRVRALEQNDFDALDAPVFAKGHLKKYAQLVGVPVDDVLADYYALNRTPGVPPVVGTVRKPSRELTPGPWLAVIVVLIVVASAYWYYVVREPGSDPPERGAPAIESPAMPAAEPTAEPAAASTAAPPAVGDDNGPDGAASDEAVDAADAAEPAVGEADAAEAGAAPGQTAATQPPVVPDGEIRLTVRFSGDCWTEITDAGGRQLYFGLGRDGRVADVTGRAPLAALFGDADNVALEVDGEPYAIDASSRRGRTARLTIRADE